MNTLYHPRDVILVAGPSACGKTKVLNQLRSELIDFGIPHEHKPLSDSHTIYDRVLEDDALHEGQGHYHPWCEGVTSGHVHVNGNDTLPFTLAGDGVARYMMVDFWKGLISLSQNGQIHLAELSAGVNVNPENEPASRTDLSFQTLVKRLADGMYPSVGLARVRAIIHPQTDDAERLLLNLHRGRPSQEEIEEGTASFKLSPTAMSIFGRDDFIGSFGPYAEHMYGIPIYSFHNDGKPETLATAIHGFVPEIMRGWPGMEGNMRSKEW